MPLIPAKSYPKWKAPGGEVSSLSGTWKVRGKHGSILKGIKVELFFCFKKTHFIIHCRIFGIHKEVEE